VIYANGLSLESRGAARLVRRPVVHKVVGDLAWERARNRGWFHGTLEAYQAASKTPNLRLLDAWRRTSLRDAAAVVTPSAYFAGIIASWGVPRSRIRVVHNALPHEPPAIVPIALPSFEGATLMTICRLLPYKGVDGLLEAVAALDRVRLVVVGDGPSRAALETQAHARSLGDRVVWTGARSAGEIQALLGAADGFVLNSSVENLPHVVLEAMRAGVPVIATAVGGVPELVIDGVTGRLVPAGDTSALVHAVAGLINSPSEGRRMAAAARARVRTEFHEDAMIDRTAGVLAEAAEQGRRAGTVGM
jgi:glycosyltransferase involved in cell wall biosynthesis